MHRFDAVKMQLRRIAASTLALATLLAAGCAGLPTESQSSRVITQDMLLAGKPLLKGKPMPRLADVDLLAMTPEMKEFVDYYVNENVSPAVRLRQLQSAIIHNTAFQLNYTSNTYTAEQTFVNGDGNCLSFTNMFIAMARYVGLKAQFQEVDVPPYWESEGGTMVLNRHINVFVRVPHATTMLSSGHHVIDFNATDVRPTFDTERVSDRRAKAHYYSNIGVDWLQAGRYPEAFVYLRESLRVDPTLHDTWINLGAVYSRAGHLAYAEEAYLTAVRNKRSMVGLSNLAKIYQRMGNEPLAHRYLDEVRRFRARNPYYRYHLARESLQQGDIDDAIDHLEKAIDLKPKEEQFYFLLGVAYWQKGLRELAMGSFEEAQALAVDLVSRRRYGYKIQQLLDSPASAVM